jgi:hypothetical protein
MPLVAEAQVHQPIVETRFPLHTLQQFSLRVSCLLEVHPVAGKKDCG